jgi:hypothetical protein
VLGLDDPSTRRDVSPHLPRGGETLSGLARLLRRKEARR